MRRTERRKDTLTQLWHMLRIEHWRKVIEFRAQFHTHIKTI